VLEDVFFEVWNKADRYDESRGAPLTYLLTLARSRSIDRRRSSARRPATAGDEIGQSDKPDRDSPTPLSDAATEEMRQRVRSAMGNLSEDQRKAVELSFFDDLSHSQIASAMGKPLGTVKTYIRQGLIRLRDALRISEGDT
jgi:RNA polymerase sigma-70 factor (ECF subfamily)